MKKRLATALIAPFAFWSVAPAMASAADFCEPMTVAVESAKAHACCGPADDGNAEAPAGGEAQAHGIHSPTGATGHASGSEAPAPHSHAGSDCHCQPADLPGLPASEAPATTIESGSSRSGFGGSYATLTVAALRAAAGVEAIQRQDPARRSDSSPPLYLLHELLLI
jgi:hypothetical protein